MSKWEVPEGLRVKMKEIARQFSKQPTRSEGLLWEALRNRQLDDRKFRRQHPIGNFVVDFYCVRESFEEKYLMARHSQKLPDTLYNYCSLDGMKKIIESASLHLSNVRQLNDRREFKELLEKFLDKFKNNKPGVPIPSFEQLFEVAPFVFCMSEEPDDLYQWISYGDGGKGVAIGFDSSKLPFAGRTIPVLYNKKRIEYFVNKFLNFIFQNSTENKSKNSKSTGLIPQRYRNTRPKNEATLTDCYNLLCPPTKSNRIT